MPDYCTIPLSKGKVALIDLEDLPRVSQYPWHARQSNRVDHIWYAYRTGPSGQKIALHRFLMDAPPGVEVDHVSGDGLDNRRANLRLATHRQNLTNQRKRLNRSSRFKGVHWCKRDVAWVARITVNDRMRCLGYFAVEQDAAQAYNAAALEHWGEFARLNVLPSTVREAEQLTLPNSPSPNTLRP